jgi:hypothetical protein
MKTSCFFSDPALQSTLETLLGRVPVPDVYLPGLVGDFDTQQRFLNKTPAAQDIIRELAQYDRTTTRRVLTLALCLRRCGALPIEMEVMIIGFADNHSSYEQYFMASPLRQLGSLPISAHEILASLTVLNYGMKTDADADNFLVVVQRLVGYLEDRDASDYLESLCCICNTYNTHCLLPTSHLHKQIYARLAHWMTNKQALNDSTIDTCILLALERSPQKTFTEQRALVRTLAHKGTSPLCTFICAH